jgi:hypothetical protein
LASIVTTDKKIVKEIFDKSKRNKIIETMLQLNLDNDQYGSAIYEGFIAYYSESNKDNGFKCRYDFSDQITLCDIISPPDIIFSKYYEVVDRINFKAKCSNYYNSEELIVACASNEKYLEKYFQNPNCIFRWLIKSDSLSSIINTNEILAFRANVRINDIECEQVNKGFDNENNNYEIIFKKPPILCENNSNNEDLVDFEIEVHTIQPKIINFVSIHLAYPVKGAFLSLNFEHVKKISDVSTIWLGTRGKNKLIWGKPATFQIATTGDQKVRSIKMPNDYWLFPDSGVTFIW